MRRKNSSFPTYLLPLVPTAFAFERLSEVSDAEDAEHDSRADLAFLADLLHLRGTTGWAVDGVGFGLLVYGHASPPSGRSNVVVVDLSCDVKVGGRGEIIGQRRGWGEFDTDSGA